MTSAPFCNLPAVANTEETVESQSLFYLMLVDEDRFQTPFLPLSAAHLPLRIVLNASGMPINRPVCGPSIGSGPPGDCCCPASPGRPMEGEKVIPLGQDFPGSMQPCEGWSADGPGVAAVRLAARSRRARDHGGRSRLVGCFHPAVSGAVSPAGVLGRSRLPPKSFDREPACQPGEFGRTLVKLLHDREGFLEPSAGRKVFQVGRLIAGDCGERRKHAAEFVCRFA